jgi:bacterioferritin-associated ferredoxin
MNAAAATAAPACRFASSEAGQAGLLCRCAGVSEERVHAVVARGLATTVVEVMATTDAGTGCRACHCRIQRVLSGLPASCGGRFDWCHACGCLNAVCRCEAA